MLYTTALVLLREVDVEPPGGFDTLLPGQGGSQADPHPQGKDKARQGRHTIRFDGQTLARKGGALFPLTGFWP